jgi:hypothetical protein
MRKKFHLADFLFFFTLLLLIGCAENTENKTTTEKETGSTESKAANKESTQFREGVDYTIFERARILDKTAFADPQEAYSLLLPTGWKHEDEIIWIQPGQSCQGTYKRLKANSADNKFSLEILPDVLYSMNTNAELMQFNQNNQGSSFCSTGEPMSAEDYFRKVFVTRELGNPQVVKIEANPAVVQQMQQMNEEARAELMRYGAGQIQFDQSAITASVKWQDQEGFILLGVTVIENTIPNVYNGTYDKLYTTSVINRIIFKYPAGETEQAKNQFSAIMGSFRTNPAWRDAVNQYWRNVRQQKHVDHIGRIKMMDERTRQIGEAAIKAGNERLQSMDANMRSWEQQQSSQDRMHTNFIKTIREVEHYRDETGKIELASGYDHAWSRSDGASFILTNSSNFNPSSVFQDNRWKEMKKIND